MTKARDAFRTISEVSDWLDTPAHVLRFWESKFSQIKPVKRAGGRRYYRPEDMALLSGIKYLLHEQGMTIKGAQKLLREQGSKHVIELGAELGVTAKLAQDEAIDGEATETAARAAANDSPAEATPYTEPAAWDPADPWPPDPGDVDIDRFDDRPASNEDAAPVMPPPPRHEVALPFGRDGAVAASGPAPQAPADVLPFGGPPRPVIPALPDEASVPAHPGALTALIGANPDVVRANSARIAPLAGRLKVLSDRIGASVR